MFLNVNLHENAIFVSGEASIRFSPNGLVFRHWDTEVSVEPFAVHSTFPPNSEGKTIDFVTNNAFVWNRKGAGTWSKTLTLNGVEIRVTFLYTSRSRYDFSISVNGNILGVSLLGRKPAVIIYGNTEQWCKDILTFMGGEVRWEQ